MAATASAPGPVAAGDDDIRSRPASSGGAAVAAGVALVALAPLAPWNVSTGVADDEVGAGAWRSALDLGGVAVFPLVAAVVAAGAGLVVLVGRRRPVSGTVAVAGGAAAAVVGLLAALAGRSTHVDDIGPGAWWAPGPLLVVLGGALVAAGGARWRRSTPTSATRTGAPTAVAVALAAATAALLLLAGPWWVQPGLELGLSTDDGAVPALRGTEVMAGWLPLVLLAAAVAAFVAAGTARWPAAGALAGTAGGAVGAVAAAAVVLDATAGTARPVAAVGAGVVAFVAGALTFAPAPADATTTTGPARPPGTRWASALLLGPIVAAPVAVVALDLPGAAAHRDGVVVVAGADPRSSLRPGAPAHDLGVPVRVVGLVPSPDGDVPGGDGGQTAPLVAAGGLTAALDDGRVRVVTADRTLPFRTVVGTSADHVIAVTPNRGTYAIPPGATDRYHHGGVRLLEPTGDTEADDDDDLAVAVGPDGTLWQATSAGGRTRLVRWSAADVAAAITDPGGLGPGERVADWTGPAPALVTAGTIGDDDVVTTVDPDGTVHVVRDGERQEVAAVGATACGLSSDPFRLGARILHATTDDTGATWLVVDTEADEDEGPAQGLTGGLGVTDRTHALVVVAAGTARRVPDGALGPLDPARVVSVLATGSDGRIVASDDAGRVVAVADAATRATDPGPPPPACPEGR